MDAARTNVTHSQQEIPTSAGKTTRTCVDTALSDQVPLISHWTGALQSKCVKERLTSGMPTAEVRSQWHMIIRGRYMCQGVVGAATPALGAAMSKCATNWMAMAM
jgi:hypothetical protein